MKSFNSLQLCIQKTLFLNCQTISGLSFFEDAPSIPSHQFEQKILFLESGLYTVWRVYLKINHWMNKWMNEIVLIHSFNYSTHSWKPCKKRNAVFSSWPAVHKYILTDALFSSGSSVKVLLPSDCYWFGSAVTGDDGDETWIVCVLEEKEKVSFRYFCSFHSHMTMHLWSAVIYDSMSQKYLQAAWRTTSPSDVLPWGWGGWQPFQMWPWLWHCWVQGSAVWAWCSQLRGQTCYPESMTNVWQRRDHGVTEQMYVLSDDQFMLMRYRSFIFKIKIFLLKFCRK